MAKSWLLATVALFSSCVWAGPKVAVETTLGNFTIELNQEKAPISVANFLRYVDDGSYVGSQFHRVIPGFMAQGGGFDAYLNQLPTYAPIENEASNGLRNDTATIAMARTQNPNSATRQFYINLVDNDFLNYAAKPPGYAVFGQVIEGFDVIEKMAQQPTQNKGRMQNVPVTPIVINKVTRLP
ncbi:TPA: peptidylprolyl isomerase [Vibrio cholerae]|jgi:peptidyl-prolyl cis-trans isomerase A (cyclophilin A)|uniref:peptidylprolyl isomerase n=1 Tax=Vibrio cholerae TaxID=666 RepID=UPI0002046AFE|nr:peptidylprolyl isomerase [Vibrio cholerae]AEA79220.1 Peptidyl-prolyl cis-trans isomerase ppiA precursor [Vibrio cholerae LMA3984-4]EHV2407315.1 peptidylprolyl isomerase [Vibrio cholerae]EHV2410742.1 peptidylprolyl isomerase [Vibrio cholerae]EHZ6900880.1 peptidylprolyl isomerase [Vibrio cholerae]EIA0776599.1 peptidylprolyl isomerase [Vibrio cholerae]